MIGKKSLKDIAWNVTEEEYRADHAYSYSTLAKFDREGFEKLDLSLCGIGNLEPPNRRTDRKRNE